MKKWLKENLPDTFELLSGLRWDLEAWIDYQKPSRRRAEHVQRSWARLMKSVGTYSVDPAKPGVLFFTVRGWPYHVAIDTLCALRLRQQGHNVQFLDCRGELPFCNMGNVRSQPEACRPCAFCKRIKSTYYEPYFPTESLGPVSPACHAEIQAIEKLNLDQCKSYEWAGCRLGQYGAGTVAWFKCRSTLREDDVPVFHSVLKACLVVADRFPVHLDRVRPGCVVMLSGDFFAERIAAHFCRLRGIRVLTHELTYYERVIAGINASVTDTLCLDGGEQLAEPLEPGERRAVQRFIRKWLRGHGYLGDSIWKDADKDTNRIAGLLELNQRPLAVAYTNLTYDMGVLGKDRTFPSIFEWLREVLTYFAAHPEWQLVVRVHPGESKQSQWRTEEPIQDFLQLLPASRGANIRIVPAESPISSYALMEMATLGLTYTSTTTVELCMHGRPVVTAGKSPFCHRGFTFDPADPGDYFETVAGILRGEIKGWSPARRDALERFVHHLFFRRILELEPMHINPANRFPIFRITDPRRLTPARCPALNALCDAMVSDRLPELGHGSRSRC